MNLIIDMPVIAAIILLSITFCILISTFISLLIYGIKIFKKRKFLSIILLMLSLFSFLFIHELSIFTLYYAGQNFFLQNKYNTAINFYQKAANLTLNKKQKALLWGEIGNTYLLMPKQGFKTIAAYNTAYINAKTYKLIQNNKIWSPLINKLFLKNTGNNNSSNWPLLAAKTYTYENRFEKAEKIYQTTENSPVYSELIKIAILQSNFETALKYNNFAIEQNSTPTLLATRANLYKMRGDVERYNIDLENAVLLCQNNTTCINKAKKLSEISAYEIFQNYNYQRKMLGFAKS